MRYAVVFLIACGIPLACASTSDENGGPAKTCDAGTTGAPGPVCNGVDVFVTDCSGGVCHHSGCDPARGLDLRSPDVADRLIDVASSCNGRLYVDPNDIDHSFLLEKLQSDTPECGSRMPLVGTTLPAETIQCVRDWIVTVLP